MRIGDIMEKCSKTASVADELQDTLEVMRAERLNAMPVIGENGEIAGVISRAAILKALPEDHLDEALEETFPASDPISPA